MFKQIKLNTLDDYFDELRQRSSNGVFLCRLTEYSQTIERFLCAYLEMVQKVGVLIQGKIPNPDKRQLSFYEETMGLAFSMSPAFFEEQLGNWMPRLAPVQRGCLAEAIYEMLSELHAQGKNENMLKNAFIKFMCWFYYKFERVLKLTCRQIIPKILYIGEISEYGLRVLRILSMAGCDVLLLEYEGHTAYHSVDPSGTCAQLIKAGGGSFPADFNIEKLRQAQPNTLKSAKPEPPRKAVCTNAWISGDIFADIQRSPNTRGGDPNYFYNVFARVNGVAEKTDYFSELFKWKLKLENERRTVLVEEQEIPPPTPEEVNKIPRRSYRDRSVLLAEMPKYIDFPSHRVLQTYVRYAYYEILNETMDSSLQKLLNKATLLLCWINRYIPKLYPGREETSVPVFLYYGVCLKHNEADFLRLLARLPVDVLILNTDLQRKCCLEDKMLFEKNFSDSLPKTKFPTEVGDVQFRTVAFNAEHELNTVLYTDTGLYRNRQFKKAVPILLQTTYEEIGLLWGEDAQYRPNFEVLDDRVMLPTLFAKVSGIAGTLEQYWKSVADLVTGDTIVIEKLPYLRATDPNPVKPYATAFFKNGRLQIQKIKAHHAYQYGYVREDMQDYMFDKLQQLINRKIIAGTMTSGMEYTIISVALNLDKKLIRLIQNFDFTRAVPKVVVINTADSVCSVEDSILLAYLNALGFDIVLFIPTGYQSVELHYTESLFVEHQTGAYQYDLQIPDLKTIKRNGQSFARKLFGRGI